MQTIQRSNGEAGAGALEMAEARYMIRVAGYLHGVEDLRNVPMSPQDTKPGGMGMGGQVYEAPQTARIGLSSG